MCQDFEAAVRELQSTTAGVTLVDSTFPVFGVGHSNGALLHLLGGALGLQRHAGDAFISFNNKCADVLPCCLKCESSGSN